MKNITNRLFALSVSASAIVGLLAGIGGTGSKPPEASLRNDLDAAIVVLPSETAVLYDTGEEINTDWIEVWRPMCGSRAGILNSADMANIASNHQRELSDPASLRIVDTPQDGLAVTLNIVFVLASSVPSAAVPAFTKVEQYLESKFTDPVTITITVSFANLGSGILGGTTPSYTTSSYTNARAGLVNNRDSTDTIQPLLPTGSTISVRYSGSSATITAENTVYWTRAAYKSTVGSVTGNDASMQFNTAFTWDYDPTNGVSGVSFVDVAIHEVGHAMGYVSAAGVWSNESTVLDLYRFQYTDGTADYNPDTAAEFTARPRLVASNSPDDAHITDLSPTEYRMSDGSPYQASHFREQTLNIGIMDPAFSSNTTFYPNYMKTSDLACFDAIGWDR
ncbi:MAG: hypothetical protein EXS00_06385 [Phycisphaerales bacterium]|nr:hypothetical protein [Phycisphaerales bacterium]